MAFGEGFQISVIISLIVQQLASLYIVSKQV